MPEMCHNLNIFRNFAHANENDIEQTVKSFTMNFKAIYGITPSEFLHSDGRKQPTVERSHSEANTSSY